MTDIAQLEAAMRYDLERMHSSMHDSDCYDDGHPYPELVREFIARYGGGVKWLLAALEYKTAQWRLVGLLGDTDLPPESLAERKEVLIESVNSDCAGMRSAAASGLGNLGTFDCYHALGERLKKETNRAVRSVIEAHLASVIYPD